MRLEDKLCRVNRRGGDLRCAALGPSGERPKFPLDALGLRALSALRTAPMLSEASLAAVFARASAARTAARCCRMRAWHTSEDLTSMWLSASADMSKSSSASWDRQRMSEMAWPTLASWRQSLLSCLWELTMYTFLLMDLPAITPYFEPSSDRSRARSRQAKSVSSSELKRTTASRSVILRTATRMPMTVLRLALKASSTICPSKSERPPA
mmetsp:Transcript_8060/g.18398  ORF Transcript_8060/g.18398 Transcript_8060/m.18398 type:complete len:211 (-) Transcript_8060:391-1023(-)